MRIGAMNHPARDPIEEIETFASMQLDFLDLTLEPPCAAPWRIDPKAIKRALADHNMGVVGHTAFYLPLASAFESLRKAAVDELKKCADQFAVIGAKWMNVHPHPNAPFHDRSFVVRKNIETMRELIEYGKSIGIGVMVENIPAGFNNAENLGDLLDALPDLGLHLDIGHSNLMNKKNTAGEILTKYGSRLAHVHLHDNNGGTADLHLPLGVGSLHLEEEINHLKACGYDDTITLEVFAEEKHYLLHSRDMLRKMWDSA